MKISALNAQNFLGARAVEIQMPKPVALFAGKNGAGKSSLRDAIALALTADLGRVSLKKDAGHLITEGGESAVVEVIANGESYAVAINAAGKISDSQQGREAPAALAYVLDAQRFAKMADNERRQFLFGLMGVKMDGPSIKQRMLDKNLDAKKIEQVLPILRAGFDAANKEAAAKARDAKASYKTATGGETWGKEKGGKWQPAALPAEAEKAQNRHDNAKDKLTEADKELAAAQQELGAAKSAQRQAHEAESKRLELHELAGKVERFQTKLNLDQSELTTWQEKVETCRAQAGGKPDPKAPGEYLLRGLASVTSGFLSISNDYPDVDWPSELINRAAAHLVEYKKLHGDADAGEAKADPEAVAKLPEYENALRLMESAVANSKRNLESAQKAAEQLKELDGLKANASTDEAEAKVADLKAKRDAWLADVTKYRDIADQYSRRQALIEQVAKLHADVLAWSDIADALAPDGIQSELLAEAIQPINDRLHASAGFAEWLQPVVHSDMRITYGLREYGLLSESEKWRVDAMIAEAVSHLSGLKLLVLDRFDVLDLKGREDLLYWLDGMAIDGEIDSALIFGTLKGLPALNFDNIEAFWIENGVSGQMKEAA